MKIVVLDGYTLNPGDLSWSGFEALGEVTVHDRTPAELTTRRLDNADVAITNKTLITAEIIAACPNLKYIGALATGYNTIDIEAAAAHGIPVSNIPTYGTQAVAQFAFALLLELCHNISAHDKAVKQGRWQNNPDFCFWDTRQVELAGKTIGIIGFGRIGQATAKIASAMGMNVLAHDEHHSDEGRALGEYVSLDELLAASDVVSLHCPLTPATQGIVNKESIAKMKDGAIIINTSRGPLINEQDLADALNSSKIAAAAVDVVSVEPIKGDNPLLKAENCIITPHIAWAPKEARARLMAIAVENLAGFIRGECVNVVNR